jgi:hypothetical protein
MLQQPALQLKLRTALGGGIQLLLKRVHLRKTQGVVLVLWWSVHKLADRTCPRAPTYSHEAVTTDKLHW